MSVTFFNMRRRRSKSVEEVPQTVPKPDLEKTETKASKATKNSK